MWKFLSPFPWKTTRDFSNKYSLKLALEGENEQYAHQLHLYTVLCYNNKKSPILLFMCNVQVHTSHHEAIIVEDKLKELAKPGTVVVHHCLSIPKRL